MGTSISVTISATTSLVGVAPGPVTNLAASAVQTDRFTLTWTVPSAGSPVIYYQVQYRETGSSTWINVGGRLADIVSTTITGLAAGREYDAQVIASNTYGSTGSGTVTATTLLIAPSAPTNITAVAASTSAITVGWTPGTSGTTPFTFSVGYRSPTGSGAYTAFPSTALSPASSLTITGLASGTSYEFEVTATNAAGSATSTTTAIASTGSTVIAPSAPTNLSVGSVSTTSAQIGWSKPTTGGGTLNYTVQFSPTGKGAWATAGTTTEPTDTLTVTGLASGTTYDFRVAASNSAGQGPYSATLTTTTTSSGSVRHPWLQPGGNDSMWNTPFGSGAVWSAATDPDTVSLRVANTVNAGYFGAPVFVAAATDPLVTFTSTAGAGSQRDPNLTVTVRCPANAQPAAPYPGGDCQMTLFDPTTDPTRVWCFGPCSFNNGTDVTGGVTAYAGEVDLVCGTMEDAVTGNFGYDQGLGVIRAWELDPTQNPSGLIQHGLRFACDVSQLLAPLAWDNPTLADGSVAIYWPQTHTDYNGPTTYTGHLPGGATVGIPSTVAMPSGLSAGGQMLWHNAQQYGWHWRDTGSGGVTLYAVPELENNALIQGMRGDLATIVGNLCVLRNQGPTAVQGGGTPIVAGPPPIDPAVCGGIIAPGTVSGLVIASMGSSDASLSWNLPTGSLPLDLIMRRSPTGAGSWTDVDAGSNATSGTVTGLAASTTYDFEVYATNSGGTGAVSAIVTGSTTALSTATWDPTQSSTNVTFSNGNLLATAGTMATGQVQQSARSTVSQTTGKWYFEVTATAITTNWAIGICNGSFNTSNSLGADSYGLAYYPVSPLRAVYYANTELTQGNSGAADVSGAVVGIVFDAAAALIWVQSDAMIAEFGAGAWNDSATADPGTGVGGLSYSGMTAPIFACWNTADTTGSATVNFGGSAFVRPIPAGCTAMGGSSSGGAVAPGQVTGLAVASTSSNSATLTWIAPTTGTTPFSYTVQESPAGAGTWTTAGTYQQTSGVISGLAANTSYDFRVFATNTVGPGADSATVTGKTAPAATTGTQLLPSGAMSVAGGQIVDSTGTPVRIACVGWNGGNSEAPGLEGLDQVYWQQTLKDMVRYGFNCVRILTCDAAVIADAAMNGVDYTINPDLSGLTYLGVLDAIFDYAASIGLRIIIDSHNNNGFGVPQQVNGLWYDSGGASNGTDAGGNAGTITDANFLSAWQTRATRWASKPALLGYDIRNEPCAEGHASPGCTWSTYTSVSGYTGTAGSNVDIHDMYQRVGAAIQAIDTRPLIICEALIDYPSGAYSGDLRCVSSYPVVLTTANKVVYSVHEYPTEVGGYAGRTDPGGLGSADSGSTYVSRMQALWGFLIQNNVAPVWVGEMGDACTTSDAQNWATTIVSYLNGSAPGGITLSGSQQGVSWDWWVWAVSETGGSVPDFGVQTAWGANGVPKSAQHQYWGAMLYTGPANGNAPLVSSPLTGTVTTGTWTLSSINGMYYWTLLPAQYDAAANISYPLVLFLHQLDQANPFYQNGDQASADAVMPQIDPWFNNVTFRTKQPCIVVAPLLDQTTDTTGGQTINWGGVSAGKQAGQDNSIALVNYCIGKYKIYQKKIFVTGNSMGGIGSWDFIIKYNSQTGLAGKVFAATLILAGADYVYNYPTPDATMVSNMMSVPIWAIHGSQDTQVPLDWDRNMYAAVGVTVTGTSGTGTGPTAAGLISYLGSITGTYTISGQFIEFGDDPTMGYAAISTIQQQTGYWLGMIGGDYWHFGASGAATSTFNQYAKTHWSNGGLVTLTLSMPNPTTGGGSPDVSALNAADLLVSGTSTNTNFMSYLDGVAAGLADLQVSAVIVLLRIFHEMNGNWFWWAIGFLSDAQFVAVWQFVHNYFTNTKGLTNLVWVWSPNAGFSNFPQTASRYPGDAYVDVVGFDLYTSSPSDQADYDSLATIAPGKARCMAEFGSGGPSGGDTSFNEDTLIQAIASTMPDTTFWQQWWDGNAGAAGWGMAETSSWADVKTALSEARVLNRGDMGAYFTASQPPQTGGGHMHYLEDANLGHDVWDTYYVEPTSDSYWTWLFSQSA